MSTKNFLLGVFSLVVLSIFIPIFSVKAATYPFNDLPCGYNNNPDFTEALCDGYLTINNDSPLTSGQFIDVKLYITNTSYLTAYPSQVTFNGDEGGYGSYSSGSSLAAWTLNPFPAPAIDGCYNMNVYLHWTAMGSYAYTYILPYQVGNVSCGGSGGGGSPNPIYNIPVPSIGANPQSVLSGGSSDITWNSTSADSCVVVDSEGYTVGTDLSGMYNTGSLYENTTYTVTCYGSLALGPRENKFADIFNNIKEKLWSIIPTALADIWEPPNEPPAASASVTVTVTQPQFSVSLVLDSSRYKDLVKYNNQTAIGSSYLKAEVNNLPSGVSCKVINTLTPASPIKTYTSSTIYADPITIKGLISSQNNYIITCTDSNTTESDTVTVLAQSGTLSGLPTCTIPSGGNKCSGFVITHNTVNKDLNTSVTLKNTNGTQVGTPSNSSTGTFSVDVNYGAQTFTSYNAVDGEDNGPSVPNTLASWNVNASCVLPTQYIGGICTNPVAIDLTASNVTPNTAMVNVAKTFSSTIKNQGTATTGSPFYNIFQTATGFDDPTLQLGPINLATYGASPSPMGILLPSASNTATRSLMFTSPGVYYVRACADMNPSSIGEGTAENNNCSPNWIPVTVSAGADLTASSTWPTTAPAGVPTTYSSIITNQGGAATGGSFINLFQVTTNLAGGTVTDYPTTSMAALNPGQSSTATKSITLSAGNYFMRACADKSSALNTGVISEPGLENNNCSTWVPLVIPTPAQPDLIAGAPTPTVAVVNVATTFRSLITNQGTAGTGGSFGNLFQVTANPVGGTITDYGTILSMPALAGNGGSSTAISPAITFTSVGTYYMRACADKTSAGSVGVIAESSEINNCSSWTPITVVTSGLPDLTAGGITPTSVMEDVATTFQVTIANIGNASTGSSFFNLIQLSPVSPGASPIVEQRISTAALPAQSSRNLSFIYTFRDAGIYYARVCADKSNGGDNTGGIPETNELNNCGVWTKITVSTDTKPDLVASAPTPTVVIINMANTFSSRITNQGTVSTGTKVNNLFQVSTSPTGASDVTDYPAEVNLPALDAGESGTTISPSIKFDKEMPFYMRACADKTSAGDVGAIPESNEGNNCSGWTEIKVQAEGLPVDGGWTEWNCGACSVSCGGGTQSCARTCTNPVPQNGGASCVGPTTTEQICNTQACGGGGAGELMVTLTASPTMIFKGRSSTLTWNSTADSCISEDFATGDKTTGTVLVSPVSTTTYKITCKKAEVEDSATATIKVINPVIIEN